MSDDCYSAEFTRVIGAEGIILLRELVSLQAKVIYREKLKTTYFQARRCLVEQAVE